MKKFIFLVLLCLGGIIGGSAFAEPASLDAPGGTKHGLKEMGFLVGYGGSSVADKGKYAVTPVIIRLGVDCDRYGLGFSDWAERASKTIFHRDWRPAGETEFLMEPFVSLVSSPDTNAEVGFTILLKYSWPLTKRFHPYALGGGGILYTSQHLREQSTQYNFTPQIGAGFSFFFDEHTAFNVEYRRRHFSNADIKKPNDGINVNMVLIGISLFY